MSVPWLVFSFERSPTSRGDRVSTMTWWQRFVKCTTMESHVGSFTQSSQWLNLHGLEDICGQASVRGLALSLKTLALQSRNTKKYSPGHLPLLSPCTCAKALHSRGTVEQRKGHPDYLTGLAQVADAVLQFVTLSLPHPSCCVYKEQLTLENASSWPPCALIATFLRRATIPRILEYRGPVTWNHILLIPFISCCL